MHLIYLIKFPSGKVYIGQTNNLKKRKTDHLKEARNGSDSKVYRAMRKYNTTRDDFIILETGIQTPNEANEREKYWIEYYNSFKEGYNSTSGGDAPEHIFNSGENSLNALLTNDEVKEIRELKASMLYSKKDIYEKFSDKIAISTFSKIWNYESYKEVCPELNTKEITEYYIHCKNSGLKCKTSIFDED